MPVAVVSFDAAGTLIAPHPGVGAVYAEVAAAHGVAADPAALEAAFPAAFTAVRDAWGVPYGRDEADARAFWATVVRATFGGDLSDRLAQALYDEFARPERWRVLPGAREALALVAARGRRAAVVSNFDGRLEPILAGLGLGPFAALVVSCRVGKAKPHVAPMMALARELGVLPRAVLHVGDSEGEDGRMCAAAGCAWLRCDPQRGIDPAALAAALEA